MAGLPEDSLMDLLLQLKKTTPEQARVILNSQPQVSYALMDLMVKLNAINMDVFQRILASYGAAQAGGAPGPPIVPQLQSVVAPLVAPAVPSHLVAPQQVPYPRGGTPQSNFPQAQPPIYPPYSNGYPPPNAPQPPSYSSAGSNLPPHLESLPEDQKAMIAQVLSMTLDQINALPPVERSSIIQLRATLGFPIG